MILFIYKHITCKVFYSLYISILDKKSKATVCEPAINPTLSRPQNDENITYRVIEQSVPSSKTIKITVKPSISSLSHSASVYSYKIYLQCITVFIFLFIL